jgi:hypothetical protein
MVLKMLFMVSHRDKFLGGLFTDVDRDKVEAFEERATPSRGGTTSLSNRS